MRIAYCHFIDESAGLYARGNENMRWEKEFSVDHLHQINTLLKLESFNYEYNRILLAFRIFFFISFKHADAFYSISFVVSVQFYSAFSSYKPFLFYAKTVSKIFLSKFFQYKMRILKSFRPIVIIILFRMQMIRF